jgi:hypothetical protein
MNVTLENEPGTFVWNLTTSGLFTFKCMYEELMNDHTPFLRKYLWKLKIPLKIKKFMWFLHNKVLLTKDNLAKRNWKGCTKCCFCGDHETIEHLFIVCPFSKLLWRMVFFAFNLPPLANITNMFGNWLNGVDKKAKDRIRIGVSALCWSIWRCRNNIVFNNSTTFNIMQVVHMILHLVQQWALLLPQDQQAFMDTGCNHLQTVAQGILSQAGWCHTSRL